MKQFSFVKLSGSGNDFVLFDKKFNADLTLNPQIIRHICNRRSGIGADGVLVISGKDGYDFAMDYYNADGSTGCLCANGSRCAIRYAGLLDMLKGGKAKFISNGIEYSGLVIDDEKIKFYLNPPEKTKLNFKIKAFDQLINASFADTGSPHVVIDIKDVLRDKKNLGSFFTDIDDFPVYELGKEIRYSNDFAPEGTNVNFVSLQENIIYIRSYERGVENETLSCGTGAVAAAAINFYEGKVKPPVKLKVQSGDFLEVNFKVSDRQINELSLTGPAVVTFKGELTI